MGLAEAFVEQHLPYRKKYIEQYVPKDELFAEPTWRQVDSFLSYGKIEKAIVGSVTLGCYASTITKIVGIDIDNHRGHSKAWLLDIYDQVVDALGVFPSVLVNSPRGLHAYWYLSEPYPTNTMKELASKRLEHLLGFIEIRPDIGNALRIPKQSAFIDPQTMEPVDKPLDTIIESAERYNAIALFFHEWLPYWQKGDTPRQKGQKLTYLKHGARIARREAEIAPEGFENGNTNSQFLQLSLLYRTSGLDIDTAYKRLLVILSRSQSYTGDILKKLRKRLEWEYANNSYEPQYREYQPTLFDQLTIDYIVQRSPFSHQRDNAIRHFTTELLKWKNYQDGLLNDPGAMQELNYRFKYYWKNRKEGYYPLPSSLLEKWNKRYYQLLPYLIEIGLIAPSPYGYSASKNGNGVSKYYSIDSLIGSRRIEGSREVV